MSGPQSGTNYPNGPAMPSGPGPGRRTDSGTRPHGTTTNPLPRRPRRGPKAS
ncbi:hypothetical protein ACWF94_35695 [Streptomyces sp. NPDC055078]